MSTASIDAEAYVLERPGEPLVKRTLSLPAPQPGDAIIQVTACGLCHTDLGFANGSVTPNKGLPIVLGHEVVGTVVSAGAGAEHLLNQPVLVPSVMPCGECAVCTSGRSNACPHQKMPGNDIDGGFATHMVAPSRTLVPLTDIPADTIRDYSVVADAVSTAYQAAMRAGLKRGDMAVIVGAGGVGGFLVQIAAAMGAKVIACDVSEDRLALIRENGADHTIAVRDVSPRDVRKLVRTFAKEHAVPTTGWRIFECSGTPGGQTLGFGLLQRTAVLTLVGFTPKKLELRLSNLMAFDATVHGSWGCPVDLYPAIFRLIRSGGITLEPFVQYAPMSQLNDVLVELAAHRLERRVILDPTNGANA